MTGELAQNEIALEAKGIAKFFPGAVALAGVDLQLRRGEVHALLGENGAGKSTLIKCLTGAFARDGGTITLKGKQINPTSTAESQACGIGTVYQEVNLLPNLSVVDNLYLGRQPHKFGMIDRRRMVREAEEVLSGYGLDIDVREQLSSFSVAVQQVVAIARAVSLSGEVLILDEPTASLDKNEVQLLFSVIRKLKADGLAIVFITHFLDQVFEICDTATVLRNGNNVGSRSLNEVTQKDIISLMLGRHLEAEVMSTHGGEVGGLLLQASGVGKRGQIEPFDLTLHKGEVVGLAGLLGSGRTETANLLFGVALSDEGTIEFNGSKIAIKGPRDAISLGFALCPEDRKNDGIVGDLSVKENIVLALQARQGWMRPIARSKAQELAEEYVKALDIRLASLDMPIRLLSGGNQQKALLARWLATEPDLLILDEPTRGIDVGAHAEIIALIDKLRGQGMSLLVASSELEELVAYASRVVVLRDRKHVAELRGDEISADNIVKAIAAESGEREGA